MHLRQITEHNNYFSSAKAGEPIPHPGGLVGDALIQAALDPEIRAIGFLGSAGTPPTTVRVDVITVEYLDARYYLDIMPARPIRSLTDQYAFERKLAEIGVSPLTLTGADIMREPRFSTARAIWRYRRFAVAADLRFRILAALVDEGSLRLRELCAAATGSQDPFASVLSMACSDELELDIISRPLSADTVVSTRS